MRRIFGFGTLLLTASILAGCPIYPDDSCYDSSDCPGGYVCGDYNKCIVTPAPSTPPTGTVGGKKECDAPSDCSSNQTCGPAGLCLPGDCTHWSCVEGYHCEPDHGTAVCISNETGKGGASGAAGSAGKGGSSAGQAGAAGSSTAGAGGAATAGAAGASTAGAGGAPAAGSAGSTAAGAAGAEAAGAGGTATAGAGGEAGSAGSAGSTAAGAGGSGTAGDGGASAAGAGGANAAGSGGAGGEAGTGAAGDGGASAAGAGGSSGSSGSSGTGGDGGSSAAGTGGVGGEAGSTAAGAGGTEAGGTAGTGGSGTAGTGGTGGSPTGCDAGSLPAGTGSLQLVDNATWSVCVGGISSKPAEEKLALAGGKGSPDETWSFSVVGQSFSDSVIACNEGGVICQFHSTRVEGQSTTKYDSTNKAFSLKVTTWTENAFIGTAEAVQAVKTVTIPGDVSQEVADGVTLVFVSTKKLPLPSRTG